MKTAGSVVGSQLTRNPASVDSQMSLALSVAENVMGGRSPTLRWVICSASQVPQLPVASGLGNLALSSAISNRSFLRRMSVKPPEEEKGIFKKKKNTEPVMVFSFSADDVAG